MAGCRPGTRRSSPRAPYDVLSSHTPLVGQYSDASSVTHHTLHSLGPMLYWLLALPARFGSPETMALWMGAVNTLAILAIVALAAVAAVRC